MPPPVIFDITRLATRLGRAVPNGIDRVDLAYAEYFLGGRPDAFGAMIGLRGRPHLVDRSPAAALVESVKAGWGETAPSAPGGDDGLPHRLGRSRLGRLVGAASRFEGPLLGRSGLWPGRALEEVAPPNAVYLNVSQFPIWMPRYLAWLDRRPDVRAVFFLHDLLPVQLPEYFRPFEVVRHRGRLEAMARRAAAVVVASESTRAAFADYLRAAHRPLPRMLVAPLPLSPHFSAPAALAPRTAEAESAHPYFVCIGTLEPRKNHLFLLQVWRELHARLGERTPHLVLVGQRGWDNENVVDMLERCGQLRGIVREAGRMTTPELRLLLERCQAVLMPTFAEGFGLPVAEALAVGAPVVASDIDVFRHYEGVQLLDPMDGPGWIDAICRTAERTPPARPNFEHPPAVQAATLLHFRYVEELLLAVT